MTKKTRPFQNETPPDLSKLPGYIEYDWYDGPLLYSVGSATERYLFLAVPSDDKTGPYSALYLVIPMSSKREKDVVEDKMTLRQSILHSNSRLFLSYDYGKSYIDFDKKRSDIDIFLPDPGIRYSFRSTAEKIAKYELRRRRKRGNKKTGSPSSKKTTYAQ